MAFSAAAAGPTHWLSKVIPGRYGTSVSAAGHRSSSSSLMGMNTFIK
jgi:hypothetical protein